MKEIYKYEAGRILEAVAGVKKVEPYSLINNWGVRFTKNGKSYDLRRWVNCYGCDLGWGIDGLGSDKSFCQCLEYIIEKL